MTNSNNDPILQHFTTVPHNASYELNQALKLLADDCIKTIDQDLTRQLRYGEVCDAPAAITFQEATIGPTKVFCMSIMTVLPYEKLDQVPEMIKRAIEKALEMRRNDPNAKS